ncbi:MAG: hypothetical protein Alpg2KO_20680 [Alphaproteobacteria bacterium]
MASARDKVIKAAEMEAVDLAVRLRNKIGSATHGIEDEAAKVLGRKLGIKPDDKPMPDYMEKLILTRIDWCDRLVRSFFRDNPNGMVLDMGAGLGTGFHRLEGSITAPGVSWVELEERTIIASAKKKILGETERYRIVPHVLDELTWTMKVHWKPGRPLMVLADRTMCRMRLDKAISVLMAVHSGFGGGDAPVFLAFDHALKPATFVAGAAKAFVEVPPTDWPDQFQPTALLKGQEHSWNTMRETDFIGMQPGPIRFLSKIRKLGVEDPIFGGTMLKMEKQSGEARNFADVDTSIERIDSGYDMDDGGYGGDFDDGDYGAPDRDGPSGY